MTPDDELKIGPYVIRQFPSDVPDYWYVGIPNDPEHRGWAAFFTKEAAIHYAAAITADPTLAADWPEL